jgi:hypothetical protein
VKPGRIYHKEERYDLRSQDNDQIRIYNQKQGRDPAIDKKARIWKEGSHMDKQIRRSSTTDRDKDQRPRKGISATRH